MDFYSLLLQRDGTIFGLIKRQQLHDLFYSKAKTLWSDGPGPCAFSSKSLLSRNPWLLVASQKGSIGFLLTLACSSAPLLFL